MKSIVILIPYFGRWPFWIDFFLTSCAHNPTVSWHFFSDCGVPAGAPENVVIHEMSFAAYKAKVRQRLQIDFDPESAYKLCDIRPAFGLIHEQDIGGFDFWGFGDIDVIYGDLRAHFTPQRLQYHLISCMGSRISGHLCLLRNNERMRYAFTRCKNWQQLMLHEHAAFDERAFSHVFLRRKNWPGWLRDSVFYANPYMRKASFHETFATAPNPRMPWIDGSFDFPSVWNWRNGALTNELTGSRQFPYLHFMIWKNGLWSQSLPEDLVHLSRTDIAKGFAISATGFHSLMADTV